MSMRFRGNVPGAPPGSPGVPSRRYEVAVVAVCALGGGMGEA